MGGNFTTSKVVKKGNFMNKGEVISIKTLGFTTGLLISISELLVTFESTQTNVQIRNFASENFTSNPSPSTSGTLLKTHKLNTHVYLRQ